MLFGAHIKKALVSWFIKNVWLISLGHVHYFPRNFIFHSLPPWASLVHVCNSLTVNSQISAPSSLKPPPSSYPKRKRLCGEEENFLKCLIFLRVRDVVNLRNGLIVRPDDSMQLWNQLETVSMKEREKQRERNRDVFLSAFFHFLSLLSSFLQSPGYLLF